jgi:hypothetical protein
MSTTGNNTTGNPDDLLPLSEAAALIPSHRAGKRVHPVTLLRFIKSGRLPAVRRGVWYFVRRADVERLAAGEPVVTNQRTCRQRAGKPTVGALKALGTSGTAGGGTSEWAKRTLREMGF